MKKLLQFILLTGTLLFYSCSQSDFGGITPPACTTSTVPQQISLDWSSDAPSYYEVSSTNTQVACTEDPFYNQDPPEATGYNYFNQASAIPSSTLLPSSPTDKTNAKLNVLGIPLQNNNFLCQITVLSEEDGQDYCTFNGSATAGPSSTATWSTVGAFQTVGMYEFLTQSAASGQSYLNNEIVIDYFDVYSQCSTVTERPYFAGVAELPIPNGVNANTQSAIVKMANQPPWVP